MCSAATLQPQPLSGLSAEPRRPRVSTRGPPRSSGRNTPGRREAAAAVRRPEAGGGAAESSGLGRGLCERRLAPAAGGSASGGSLTHHSPARQRAGGPGQGPAEPPRPARAGSPGALRVAVVRDHDEVLHGCGTGRDSARATSDPGGSDFGSCCCVGGGRRPERSARRPRPFPPRRPRPLPSGARPLAAGGRRQGQGRRHGTWQWPWSSLREEKRERGDRSSRSRLGLALGPVVREAEAVRAFPAASN